MGHGFSYTLRFTQMIMVLNDMWHNKIKLFLVTILLSMSGSVIAQYRISDLTTATDLSICGLSKTNSAIRDDAIREVIKRKVDCSNLEKLNTQPNLSATIESILPLCQGSDSTRWTNCTGTFVIGNNYKYVGEYLNGKRHGLGVVTYQDGRLSQEGIWSNDVFVRAEKIFEHIPIAEELQKANKNIPWSDRVSQVVAGALKKWLEESGSDLKEIPSPAFPPALKLSQEIWESNKEFENRVAVERSKRQKEIDAIQADYKSKVDQRNAQIQQLNAVRLEKERSLSSKRKEYLGHVLAATPDSTRNSPVV
jgi:hypothetical protein